MPMAPSQTQHKTHINIIYLTVGSNLTCKHPLLKNKKEILTNIMCVLEQITFSRKSG